jgi:hypothetical protein
MRTPCLTSLVMLQFFVTKQNLPIQSPRHPPDLAPCDLCLCLILKTRLSVQFFSSRLNSTEPDSSSNSRHKQEFQRFFNLRQYSGSMCVCRRAVLGVAVLALVHVFCLQNMLKFHEIFSLSMYLSMKEYFRFLGVSQGNC